jgi:CRP/FNR family transcriptional regulator, cyclic AMP receptor protein
MSVPVEVLRRVPLLSKVDDAELDALAARFVERVYDRGTPVVSRGSNGAGFFIIAEGEATVDVGGGGSTVARLGKGDCFGEIALIDGGKRSRDITATTNVRAWGISRDQFRIFVKGHPDVAWALLEVLAGRLRATEVATPKPVARQRRRWTPKRRRQRA